MLQKDLDDLKQQALTGEPTAMFQYGIVLMRDFADTSGLEFVQKAAASGLPDARIAIAMFQITELSQTDLQSGEVDVKTDGSPSTPSGKALVRADPAAGIATMTELAESGYPPAMLNLGYCYGNGLGVKEDLKMAFQWFDKAANANFPQAMYLVAMHLLALDADGESKSAIGKGASAGTTPQRMVPGDTDRAIQLLTRAATEGHFPMAMGVLGSMMSDSDDIKIAKEGVKWLKEAATNGHIASIYRLGELIEQGRAGEIKNVKEGAHLKLVAVRQGYDNAAAR